MLGTMLGAEGKQMLSSGMKKASERSAHECNRCEVMILPWSLLVQESEVNQNCFVGTPLEWVLI